MYFSGRYNICVLLFGQIWAGGWGRCLILGVLCVCGSVWMLKRWNENRTESHECSYFCPVLSMQKYTDLDTRPLSLLPLLLHMSFILETSKAKVPMLGVSPRCVVPLSPLFVAGVCRDELSVCRWGSIPLPCDAENGTSIPWQRQPASLSLPLHCFCALTHLPPRLVCCHVECTPGEGRAAQRGGLTLEKRDGGLRGIRKQLEDSPYFFQSGMYNGISSRRETRSGHQGGKGRRVRLGCIVLMPPLHCQEEWWEESANDMIKNKTNKKHTQQSNNTDQKQNTLHWIM